MNKKKNEKKERFFTKDQIKEMNIKAVEKDLLTSRWGKDIFKSESEISKILNRKENI